MVEKIQNISVIILITFVAFTCTDKFDLPDSNPTTPSNTNFSDTLYIQKFPVWDGFNKPQDVLVGKETFIYVADTDNDRIVMLNVAGQILGIKEIKRPIALAQDYRLNLFVCAEFDTVISGAAQTYSAVYKLNIVEAGHSIGNASVKRILPSSSFDLLRPDRKYTGVCTFYDNSYYVSRTGPANSNPIDPDNSILRFRQLKRNDGIRKDTLIGRIPLLQPEGTGLLSTSSISSLTSFSNGTRDIIVTLTGENSFKTQWWRYIISERFEGYQNSLAPFSTSLMVVNKFNYPEGATLDNADNIYVADAEKDSVYKFNSSGDELESFGGSEMFNSPHAVAYLEGTLYVADTENDRILRFTLSTEIE